MPTTAKIETMPASQYDKTSGATWLFRVISSTMQISILGVLIWIGATLKSIEMGFGLEEGYGRAGVRVFSAPVMAVNITNTPTMAVVGTPAVSVIATKGLA
ncbi:Protein of unknown function [Pyronema omphalodes CBS 100304]|uniref:Uncharacterized protein n=1 Tax=Pyronema omphalodes (strain CBS 100304) TaxID=1076935 RepID=U4LPA2_PYROM|nr:Protein of unknown function [Pyronema omphalodes CBS 100304]